MTRKCPACRARVNERGQADQIDPEHGCLVCGAKVPEPSACDRCEAYVYGYPGLRHYYTAGRHPRPVIEVLCHPCYAQIS